MTDETQASTLSVLSPDIRLADLPCLGAEIPGAGGIFGGIAPGPMGGSYELCALIVGPEADGRLNWQSAMDFAAGLDIDGHTDFSLPTRSEQAILFGSVRSAFSSSWYWSCEQRAESAGYAWVQDFGDGFQDYGHKANEFRARAVRRLIIR